MKIYSARSVNGVLADETGNVNLSFDNKEDKSEKGVANGYTPLNEFAKIASQYLNIVNDLTTGGTESLASAETVKTLKGQIDVINILLTSDNINLDTVQEIVDAIEAIQISLDTILVNDLTTGGVTKALTAEMGKELKRLIDNIAVEPDVYLIPTTTGDGYTYTATFDTMGITDIADLDGKFLNLYFNVTNQTTTPTLTIQNKDGVAVAFGITLKNDRGGQLELGTLPVLQNSSLSFNHITYDLWIVSPTLSGYTRAEIDARLIASQISATAHIDYLTSNTIQGQLDQTEDSLLKVVKIGKIDFKNLYQTGLARPDNDVSVLTIAPANTLTITGVDGILFVNEIIVDSSANKLPDFLKSFGNRTFVANAINTPLAVDTRGLFYVGVDKLGSPVYRTNKFFDQDICYLARVLVQNSGGVYTIVSYKYFPDLANNRANERDRLVSGSGNLKWSTAGSISFQNTGVTFLKNSVNYSIDKLDPNYLVVPDSVNPSPMSFLFLLPNIVSLSTSIVPVTTINPKNWYLASGAIGGANVANNHYQVYKLSVTVGGVMSIQTIPSTNQNPQTGVNAIFASREDALAGLTSVVFPEILPLGDSIAIGTFYLRAGTPANGSGMTNPDDFYFRPFGSSSSSSSVGVTNHDSLSGKNDNPAFLHVTTTDIANWNKGWSINGNSGTNPATDFIGTTSNQPLMFRLNNINAGRLSISNNALGYTALNSILSGVANSIFGTQGLFSATTASYNTAMGEQVMYFTLNGSRNTAFGFAVLKQNISGNDNVGIGYAALSITTGSNNTALGASTGASNGSGTSNIFIGYLADCLVNNLTNAIAIGANAKVGASNTMVLGGTGANAVKVSIGGTTATKTLDVVGDGKFLSTLTLGAGTTTAPSLIVPNGTLTTTPQNGAIERDSNGDLWETHNGIRSQLATTAFVLANSSVRPYKVYTALITQTGTSAPTAIVLENTLGVIPVYAYTAVGHYSVTATAAFVLNKTFILLDKGGSTVNTNLTRADNINANELRIQTFTSAGTPVDGVINSQALFEIRVYN